MIRCYNPITKINQLHCMIVYTFKMNTCIIYMLYLNAHINTIHIQKIYYIQINMVNKPYIQL